MVGLGTWLAEGGAAERAVSAALHHGYRHIDTATGYGNEAEVGRAMATVGIDRDHGLRHDEAPPDHAGRVRRTLTESLAALGVDHLDLWLIHWPPAPGRRPRRRGRHSGTRATRGSPRSIGVSNYSIAQIDELVAATGEAPAVNQIPYSPRDHDPDLLAAHRERGVVVEGYSPFKRTGLAPRLWWMRPRAHGVTPTRWSCAGTSSTTWSSSRSRSARSASPRTWTSLGFALTDDEMASIDALGRAAA